MIASFIIFLIPLFAKIITFKSKRKYRYFI